MTKAVIIISGGLDSTTLLYQAKLEQNFDIVQALSFNYGQRHKKELDFAKEACENLHVPWSLIDLWSSGLPDLLSASASSLVSNTEVPEGHYAEDSMKATVVPNRNMMMLSIAGAVAVAMGADTILTGVHAGDHFVYPDCRPGFIALAGQTLEVANEGFWNRTSLFPPIYAPYIDVPKTAIAYAAIQSGLAFDQTWSCYKGGKFHCGRCGTCVERLEAISEAVKVWNDTHPNDKTTDDTPYEDYTFWREATAKVHTFDD